MHPELLQLSLQIALLVLIASALAFVIGRWSRRASSTPSQAGEAQQQVGDQQLNKLKATLAETEKQCVAALEQRDSAEQQAAQHVAETRRLQEALQASEREAMTQRTQREESHATLRAEATQLLEAKLREVTINADAAKSELQQLKQSTIAKAEHEAALNKAHLELQRLTDERDQTARALEQAEFKLREIEAREGAKLGLEQAKKPSLEREQVSIPPIIQARSPTIQVIAAPPVGPTIAPQPVEEVFEFPPAPVLNTFKRSHFKSNDTQPQSPDASNLSAARETLNKLRVVSASPEPLGTEERERTPRHIEAMQRALAIAEAPNAKADDLTLIKGVKVVLNKQLQAHGIFSYRQIAGWSEADIQAFGEMLAFKQRIRKDRWQEQARQLHEARYGERL